MKISFCTIGFQNNKWGAKRVVEKSYAEIVPLLAAAGYDGVETWYPHVESLDPAAVRGLVAGHRLAIPMLSSYYNFTKTPDTAAESVRHALEVVARAQQMGALAIRIFTGGDASAAATPEQWSRAAECLQQIADAAAPHNIRLACETHRGNLTDTVAGSLELLRRVSRPNVGLILQPSTFGENYLAACETLAPHAFHVHATNARDGKNTALEDGTMDYRQIIALLRRHNFSGYISIEWMGAEPADMARREAKYLRSL